MQYWVVTAKGKVSGPFTVHAEAWRERTRKINAGERERDVAVVKAETTAEALKYKPR